MESYRQFVVDIKWTVIHNNMVYEYSYTVPYFSEHKIVQITEYSKEGLLHWAQDKENSISIWILKGIPIDCATCQVPIQRKCCFWNHRYIKIKWIWIVQKQLEVKTISLHSKAMNRLWYFFLEKQDRRAITNI